MENARPRQVQIVTDPIIIQEAEDITTKLRLMIKKKSSLGQEPSTKKLFDDNEGEYVDYEEIKE